MTLRQIGEKLGFTHKEMRGFLSRYNLKQKKLAVGIPPKPKWRPRKGKAREPSIAEYITAYFAFAPTLLWIAENLAAVHSPFADVYSPVCILSMPWLAFVHVVCIFPYFFLLFPLQQCPGWLSSTLFAYSLISFFCSHFSKSCTGRSPFSPKDSATSLWLIPRSSICLICGSNSCTFWYLWDIQ